MDLIQPVNFDDLKNIPRSSLIQSAYGIQKKER